MRCILAPEKAAGTNAQITDTYYDTPTTATNGMQSVTQNNLRKRVAASTYRDTQAGQVQQATYYNYDLDGNVSTLYQQIAGLGLKQINYEYDLISGKVNFVSYQNGQPDQFYYLYNYDADNRLTEAWSGTAATIMPNGGSYLDNGKMDASYKYYLHGPLARMELGDITGKIQGIDYAYTMQGWQKGVNSTLVNVAADMGGDGHTNNVSVDAYGYTLYYYPNDYSAISTSTGTAAPFETVVQTLATFNPLYNGNIAATAVNIPQIDVVSYNYYTHQYDQLNRLTHTEDYTTTGEGNTGLTHTDNYKEYFTYDGNGNILTTNRNGNTLNGNQLVMDQLTYNYNRDANGKLLNNRLGYIGDAAPASSYTNDLKNQSAGNYQFDAIGDLVSDQQAGVSNTQWTVYHKIQSLANSSGTINYTYDPAGQRATKTVTGVTTYYVRDAIGNTLATYDNAGGAINWREQDLYGSSRIGMWTPNMKLSSNNAQTIWDTVGHKSYELTNQLDNVMVTISDKRINSIYGINLPYYIPDITTAQHYYAFGSLMPNLTFIENNSYKYGFNGKENDNEIKGVGNQQDYGRRIYDPRVGRFLSIDPLQHQYPELTPYQFSENTPIQAIDLDGLEADFSKAKADLLKYNSDNSKDPLAPIGTFIINTAINIYDGVVDMVEMGINYNPATNIVYRGKGYAKLYNTGKTTVVGAYDWTTNTTWGKKRRDLKSAASNPHTYEALAAVIVTHKLGKITGPLLKAETPVIVDAEVENVVGKIITTGVQHGTDAHWASIMNEAKSLAGQGETVFVNRGINANLGKIINGIGNWRPDILSINKAGVINIVEVISPSQTASEIINKVGTMANALIKEGYKVTTKILTESGKEIK